MKTELSKIAQDLEQGIISGNEARSLLLGLLGVSVPLPDNYVPFTTTEEFNKKLGEFLSSNER